MHDVYPILLARLRTTGETPMVHPEGAWDAALSLLLELTKDGIKPRVDRRDEWILGRQFRTRAVAASGLLIFRVFRENTYCSSVIEIGTGQRSLVMS